MKEIKKTVHRIPAVSIRMENAIWWWFMSYKPNKYKNYTYHELVHIIVLQKKLGMSKFQKKKIKNFIRNKNMNMYTKNTYDRSTRTCCSGSLNLKYTHSWKFSKKCFSMFLILGRGCWFIFIFFFHCTGIFHFQL